LADLVGLAPAQDTTMAAWSGNVCARNGGLECKA
jgi:hypothetical protein